MNTMKEQDENGKLAAEKPVSLALWGIALAFISGISTSSSLVIVKYLNNFYPGQLAAYRFWCISSLAFPQITWKKEEILGPPGYRLSILLMAFANTSGVCSVFFASRYLPLAEAAVLCGSYPAFVTVAGKLFLKEAFGILHLTALFATIAGLILTTGLHQIITENSFTTENIYGFVAALSSIAGFTVSFLMWRKAKEIHHSVLLFSGGIVGILESIVLTVFLGNLTLYHSSSERGFIILLGFLSYVAFTSAVLSVHYVKAGPAAVLKTSADIFSAFVFQVVIFGEEPEIASIFGAVLVCIAIALLGLGQKYGKLMPNKCLNLF